MRGAVTSVLTAMAIAAAGAVAAQTPDAVLRALFEQPLGPEAFTPEFLVAVPLPQLEALLAPLRAQIGLPVSVLVQGDAATITTASHRVEARISLDATGRIAGLFVQPATPIAADLGMALASLVDVGGTVAWLVLQDGQVRAEQAADVPLAVASAFKLGVLAVLARDIAEGQRDWADVVRLQPQHRSLPTGQMQDWPDQAPVTLQTAATLMISQSDNTATDLLIDTLGADRIAEALGIESQSLLTTRQMFALKANPQALAAWRAASPAARPGLARQAAQDLPPVGRVIGLHAAGAEWYVPLTRLCALMEEVATLPLMAVNPGPLNTQDWESLAYKGGAEQGVLTFVAGMRTQSGARLCVATTWNKEAEINLAAAQSAWRAVLALLAMGKG